MPFSAGGSPAEPEAPGHLASRRLCESRAKKTSYCEALEIIAQYFRRMIQLRTEPLAECCFIGSENG